MSFCSKNGVFAGFIIAVVAISQGCSVLPNPSSRELPADIPAAQADSQANYYVEIHASFGQPKLYTGSINEPTTVQQALEISGALSDVKSPQVDLYRMLPGGAPPLKMPVEFKGKRVKYEQDYSLHPNDRIIVRSQSNSAFDRLVDSLTPGK